MLQPCGSQTGSTAVRGRSVECYDGGLSPSREPAGARSTQAITLVLTFGRVK